MRSLETAEMEITGAAIRTYGRVLRAIGRMITTHTDGVGGLICEDRSVRARPTMWRISADGSLLPDSRYSFRTRAFTATMLPGRIAPAGTGTTAPQSSAELGAVLAGT